MTKNIFCLTNILLLFGAVCLSSLTGCLVEGEGRGRGHAEIIGPEVIVPVVPVVEVEGGGHDRRR